MNRFTILLPVLIIAFTALSLNAEVYEWIDEKGVKRYTDYPPPDSVKTVKVVDKIPHDEEAQKKKDEADKKIIKSLDAEEKQRDAAEEKQRKTEQKAKKSEEKQKELEAAEKKLTEEEKQESKGKGMGKTRRKRKKERIKEYNKMKLDEKK